MQSSDISMNSAVIELAETERGIPQLHTCIDQQRRLVEALALEGRDIGSATIILDSLIFSLFLCVEDRQRARAERHANKAHAA
jgi:hypothetical protein